MSALNPEEQLAGVVDLEAYKKAHPEKVAQSTADALNQPVTSRAVQSPRHDLNDHTHQEFRVISQEDLKKADIKYPEVPESLRTATIQAPDIPGISTINRLLTKVGFAKSEKYLNQKQEMLNTKAKALYGKDAAVQLVDENKKVA